MKKFITLILFVCFSVTLFAQTVTSKLNKAFEQFQNDPQLQSAIASLYVIDAKTGAVIFDKNSTIGLAPASTQKIFTSTTAYELLGKDFQYKTAFGLGKEADNTGSILYIMPSGDPTLGSWRWDNTKEDKVIQRIAEAVKNTRAKQFSKVVVDNRGWESETIPGGWIWEDIGNYYGAGAEALNWRENQFDLILKSGAAIGDPVQVVETKPKLYNYNIISYASAAAKGTGDNSFIYLPLNASTGVIRGTIPVNENQFVVSGAMPSGSGQFTATLLDTLFKAGITTPKTALIADKYSKDLKVDNNNITVFYTEYSPSLDSIVYWFLKKSINLYGEALLKTIAYTKKGEGATDVGVDIVRNFWKEKGLPETELNIVDGSGLSPLNRVTTHAQITVLKYAKDQSWFSSFYNALPEYNGMKMKSGTIHAVKGFAGYHTSQNGEEYIFSFLVNNYNGTSSSLVQKMYKVLDVLKG